MGKKRDDEMLEKLLRSLPEQKDTRSREEILKRLQDDGRLSGKPSIPSRRRKKWRIPAAAAAAAVLLAAALLVPAFLDRQNGSRESADAVLEDRDDKAADQKLGNTQDESEKSMPAESRMMMETDEFALKQAVYADELDGRRILHIGLQDSQAVSLPVSLTLTGEQLSEKGLAGDSTDLEIYRVFAGELDEETLGFEDYHPYQAELKEEGARLDVLLDDDHGYDRSAAAIEVFFHSLQQTFPSYEEIRILDSSGNPAEFDEMGTVPPIHPSKLPKTPYFVYTKYDKSQLLAPSFMQRADSFAEAVSAMQTEPNDLFTSPIPAGTHLEAEQSGQLATVTFDPALSLGELGKEQADLLMDSLALTAASFGLELQLRQVEPSEWNGIDLRHALPAAAGANPRAMTIGND
ncbi:hypothetical protein [Sporosarcina koreensis]|uniref:hypothetical protein n=1 Tax=Sporosarcina koreensis TaxID=334735 RepID=UPI000590D38A|nr:hypothetical protein [Sporosarcina koreensis]